MNKFGLSLFSGVCAAALAVPAMGQEPAPQGSSAQQSDEIVVTALRRSENLQSVPVSITALGGDKLANQHIQQVSDLAGSVPNLQASPAGGDALPIFSLRGISMSDFNVNQQGPVATYFDEVYKGSFPLLPLGMFDLERVEVLRGPQGTLYGKNTTGGAINFISRKPGYETEGYLKIGYGNYNRFDADGAVQGALGSKVAARIAFTFSRANGWYQNKLAGEPDLNAVRQYGVRASFLAEPSDKLSFVLRLSTSLQNPFNYGIYARPDAAGVGAGVYELFGGSSYFRTGIGRREIESNYAERYRQRTYGAALTGTWKLSDSLTITSVTSYDYGKLFLPEDTDGSPLRVLESDYRGKAKQVSQDLRIASDYAGPINFILGAYYNSETIRGGTTYRYFNDLDVTGDGAIDANDCLQDFFLACTYNNDYKQKKTSYAVYSDVNYKISDQIILRGGLRYTHDRGRLEDFSAQLLSADGTALANTVPGDPTDPFATTGTRFQKGTITGKIGLDFKTSDNDLIYASFSRGYRANAFNAQAFFSPTELTVAKPETVNAYELGFKSQFLDRAVTLNGAIFYYDYRNQQALNVDDLSIQTLINIPKSRILGGELELIARPVSSVRINAGLGFLSTKIREGVLSGQPLVGNRLPNAPKLTASAGVDWDVIDNSAGKLTANVNASYTSKQFYDLFNTDRIAQKGYALVNGQLSYRFADDRFGVSAWGKNIFNKFYHRYAIDLSPSFGFDYIHLGDPRTFGMTLDAKF
ncbi:TonB-dependent receptor [Sphingobium sp. EP60837]|uniref:TonB-dependent receptor n=1 Tax=Sphingobium sp. EP60837 TaxID=1855519 RepID=UPI0007DD26E5|nr:TonB-dependent receptor [Sphingobium sp. EP60837]ANI79249.1 Pesticin receptor [Sphingobium sp. EP60837]